MLFLICHAMMTVGRSRESSNFYGTKAILYHGFWSINVNECQKAVCTARTDQTKWKDWSHDHFSNGQFQFTTGVIINYNKVWIQSKKYFAKNNDQKIYIIVVLWTHHDTSWLNKGNWKQIKLELISYNIQGHATTIFGRISVRKTIWDLEFSKYFW